MKAEAEGVGFFTAARLQCRLAPGFHLAQQQCLPGPQGRSHAGMAGAPVTFPATKVVLDPACKVLRWTPDYKNAGAAPPGPQG